MFSHIEYGFLTAGKGQNGHIVLRYLIFKNVNRQRIQTDCIIRKKTFSCHVRQWLWLWAGVYVSLFYATLKFQLKK